MGVRLLFVIGIAAAFLVLTPVSASAHCHEPTAYSVAQEVVETSGQGPSGECGQAGRKGSLLVSLGFGLSALMWGTAGALVNGIMNAYRFPPAVAHRIVDVPDVDALRQVDEGPPPRRARRIEQQAARRASRQEKRAGSRGRRELEAQRQAEERANSKARKRLLKGKPIHSRPRAKELANETLDRVGHTKGGARKIKRVAEKTLTGRNKSRKVLKLARMAQEASVQSERLAAQSQQMAYQAKRLDGGRSRRALDAAGEAHRLADEAERLRVEAEWSLRECRRAMAISEREKPGDFLRDNIHELRQAAEDGYEEGDRWADPINALLEKVSEGKSSAVIVKASEKFPGIVGALRGVDRVWPKKWW